jgi:outer membrane protein OmpA-like peptidoglycan-associated protein
MVAQVHTPTVVAAALAAVVLGQWTDTHAEGAVDTYGYAPIASDNRPAPGHYSPDYTPQTAVDPIQLQSELAASRAELQRTAERLESTQFLLQQAREALVRNYSESRRQRQLQAKQAARIAAIAALENELAWERTTNQQLRAESVSLNERGDTAESQYRSCQDRLATLNGAQTIAQQTLADTSAERDRLHAELNEATAALQEREDALARASAAETAARAQRDAMQVQLATLEADIRNVDVAPTADERMAQSTALAGQLQETKATLAAELAGKAALQQALADAISTRERLLALMDRLDNRPAYTPAQGLAATQGETAHNELQQQLLACNERLAAAKIAFSASALTASDAAVADSGGLPAPPQATELAALEAAVAQQESGDSDADGIPDRKDLCPDSPVNTKVDAMGCAPDAPITLAGIGFRYDSDVLTGPSRAALDRVAGILLEQPTLRLEIAGHTDTQGDAAYNLWLSEQRARSVMAYLVSQGVQPERLNARGYGGTQPIAANTTRGGLARNRRVELHRQP